MRRVPLVLTVALVMAVMMWLRLGQRLLRILISILLPQTSTRLAIQQVM